MSLRIEDYALIGDLETAAMVGRDGSIEYDTVNRRLLGNFPQAFSHLGIINTAFNLTRGEPHPAVEREES